MSDHKKNTPLTRRDALRRVGSGFGMMAFAGMLSQSMMRAGLTSPDGSIVTKLDYPQRVKRVIFLFMNGGLSTIDAFDPKPALDKYDGKPMPGGSISTERRTGELMKSPYTFKKSGQCGMEISDLWPHLAGVADDICWVRSVFTEIPNHEPSCLMMNTGANQAGRPSMGAWITYGLGTENQNLPGYVVLCPDIPTTVGPPLWSNGFLPAINQGTYISNKIQKTGPDGEPLTDPPAMPPAEKEKAAADKEKLKKILVEKNFDPKKILNFVNNPKFTLVEQRRELDLLQKLEEIRREDAGADPQVEAVIKSMETAYRMQTEAPEVFDIRKESQATLDMYGEGDVARGALTAVRLAEKGVRMVQLYYSKGDPWDAHTDILLHKVNAKNSDQAFAAVVKDLKQRGLWKDTLVVCGSEFGRTPVREVGGGMSGGIKRGRDHNPFGFTMWLAGGAVKGGTIYGATDDFGFKAIDKPVHVHDIHATVLYLLGIDHTKLTYRYSGRDFRLTDVAGNVLHDLVA
ncbi:MAG TPA: DUF1501 domain-containing protein [Bryobacteraceae bacterium]|nr:DUF1501 domain-containing protein [Bryobacteraceae bacterium]